jgi:hypothetical protein
MKMKAVFCILVSLLSAPEERGVSASTIHPLQKEECDDAVVITSI